MGLMSWFSRKPSPGKSVSELVAEGFEAQGRGDLEQARAAYEMVLARDARHADASYLLGVLDLRAGSLDRAVSRFDRAIGADSSIGTFHFSRGEALRALGRLPDSLAAFEQAVHLSPDEAVWWHELGRTRSALGETATAIAACRRATELDPELAAAWQSLGEMLMESKDLEGAEEAFGTALARSQSIASLLGLAAVAKQGGDLVRAETCYRTILERDADNVVAMANLAGMLVDAERHPEAEALSRRAVAIEPRLREAWINLGVAVREQGRRQDAMEVLRHALEVDPASTVARRHLARSLEEAGDLAAAERELHEALVQDPQDATTHFDLANLLRVAGSLAESEVELRRAIDLLPTFGAAWVNYGKLLQETGRIEEGARVLERAVEVAPELPEAHLNLGVARLHLGHSDAAEVAFARAIELRPGFHEALLSQGTFYLLQGRLAEAEASTLRALEIMPDSVEPLVNLAVLLYQQGRIGESLEASRRIIARKPDHANAWSNLLMTLNYSSAETPQTLSDAHRRFGSHFAPRRAAASLRRKSPQDRLRIGYVSPDFRFHVVAFFFEPVLESHDRDRFEIICYYNEHKVDDITRRIRAQSSLWREIAELDDDQTEALMLADRLDIVIDLAGHTGRNRLPVLARRVAPVQVTWLGYPNTTGLEAMDWRITDARADPAPSADAHHTERLFRMPEVFLSYRPPLTAPAVSPAPSLEAGFVTFGAYNNFAKVSDELLGLWGQILRDLPTARLVMKTHALRDSAVQERVRERLEKAGCDLSRVALSGILPDLMDHFASFGKIDIALDSYPYHGTTTTCDSLWMGVPVITLAGDRHASRVGVSLLECVGAGELVAHSGTDYVARAVSLARDPARLSQWRSVLRDRMMATVLTDHRGFTRQLEDAYREMYAET